MPENTTKRPGPKPRFGIDLHIYLDPALKAAVEALADREGLTISALGRKALKAYVATPTPRIPSDAPDPSDPSDAARIQKMPL